MRTTEERIEKLHRRAEQLERQRNRRQLMGLGGLSAGLAVLLLAVMIRMDVLTNSIDGSRYTGSSLLSESAGGYVLAAVFAFFIGVILTAVIFRYRKR